MAHCTCGDLNDGSCEFCQAYYAGEIDSNGNLTEYGKSLIGIVANPLCDCFEKGIIGGCQKCCNSFRQE